MKVLVDFTVVPIVVGTSVSSFVAACERMLAEAGLHHVLYAYGTKMACGAAAPALRSNSRAVINGR